MRLCLALLFQIFSGKLKLSEVYKLPNQLCSSVVVGPEKNQLKMMRRGEIQRGDRLRKAIYVIRKWKYVLSVAACSWPTPRPNCSKSK